MMINSSFDPSGGPPADRLGVAARFLAFVLVLSAAAATGVLAAPHIRTGIKIDHAASLLGALELSYLAQPPLHSRQGRLLLPGTVIGRHIGPLLPPVPPGKPPAAGHRYRP